MEHCNRHKLYRLRIPTRMACACLVLYEHHFSI